ncbi:hypothetical protein [Heliothis virescens ascovirus 3h]|uniref:Uncharacterized protein n=1 Tax=Heliothis virescens ascovirus 3h TaxID=1268039 RepID=A0A386JAL6_9VIRU|nr:hypothetical protein [Heliothis virescens ascovirus 3h]
MNSENGKYQHQPTKRWNHRPNSRRGRGRGSNRHSNNHGGRMCPSDRARQMRCGNVDMPSCLEARSINQHFPTVLRMGNQDHSDESNSDSQRQLQNVTDTRPLVEYSKLRRYVGDCDEVTLNCDDLDALEHEYSAIRHFNVLRLVTNV